MFKESRISCPYCNEQIMQDAKKCPICKEWIKKEPPKQEVKTTSEEAKTHKTSSIIKLPIFFVVIGLGISFGIYEYRLLNCYFHQPNVILLSLKISTHFGFDLKLKS